MSIAVLGSINVDIITRSERLPKPGETLHGQSYTTSLGGKGCNQAVAARKLGSDTTLIGRVGKDSFGQLALDNLREFGVPLTDVMVDENTATGIAVIGVDANAENSITVIGGANMAVDSSDVARTRSVIEEAKILMIQLEVPVETCLEAAALCRAAGGTVIFDPAPAPAHGLPAGFLENVDVVTPNETETHILTGILPTNEAEAQQAAEKLHAKGISAAIVKLGANGVYYSGYGETGFIKPFKVESIDSVAAGDCFNGGLAHALHTGLPFGEAVRYAAACGALATTKIGAAPAAPTAAEVEALLNSQ
ncbi:ribokinase [Pseudovibrio exalbescens]|uniref:ribokinase n=1 Tax=Pseudovibrio exalbescens TaxID=197461 RepID=UPI0023666CBB|nr:ribokinase [Pseudovibrio exalbescens]MDD7910836.1 ribokinase [Pseudovibrio exalbescens]